VTPAAVPPTERRARSAAERRRERRQEAVRREQFVSELIAIGYPDEETAFKAAEEVERLSKDLIIQPDAVAVIVRDRDGRST
jgi:hypothetical protein